MTTPTELNYAPRPPVYHRNVFRKWFVAIVLLAVAISGLWWFPPVARRIELLYWQHRCMVYVPNTQQVVFDPKSNISVTPAEWSEFYRLLSPPGFRSSGTVFLHEMKTPRGESRLVVVDLISNVKNPILSLPTEPGNMAAVCRIFIPGDLLQQPCDLHKEQSLLGPNWSTHFITPPTSVAAGTIDLDDPSHFTVDCIENGLSVIYDGWLTNENTVDFEKRQSSTWLNPGSHSARPVRISAPYTAPSP